MSDERRSPTGSVGADASFVVVVGNPSRGDDGVGPAVARAFDARWPGRATILVTTGDLSDLLFGWRSDQRVVVVDAISSGRVAGSIVRIDGLDGESTGHHPTSSHGLDVNDVIALASALRRCPATMTVFGVEGACYGLFEPLSQPVADAIDDVVDRIASEFVSDVGRGPTSPDLHERIQRRPT